MCLGESRGWDGRGRENESGRLAAREKMPGYGRGPHMHFAMDQNPRELHLSLQHCSLLFGLFALGDCFTKAARMFAIERFRHSDTEGIFLGIFREHSDPGDRLEESPLAAD